MEIRKQTNRKKVDWLMLCFGNVPQRHMCEIKRSWLPVGGAVGN
jgi:hypothetical protein